MLLNHTNHSSVHWSQKQINEAQSNYGDIVDLPFPNVDPEWDDAQLEELVQDYFAQIDKRKPDVVLCQGEFVYTYRMVRLLKSRGITVLAACSKRTVKEYLHPDGTTRKESVFEFVQFRKY